MFSIIRQAIIVFSMVLFFSCLLIFPIHAEETKTSSVSVGQAGNTQVESGQVNLSSDADKSKEISAGQGQIIIDGETGTISSKDKSESTLKGVSISRGGKGVSGSVSASKSISQPKNMTKIKNLRKPDGKISKAQSIKRFSKGVESEELNRLEQKRLKRKANFKKTLEKRRAQKALKKDQKGGER